MSGSFEERRIGEVAEALYYEWANRTPGAPSSFDKLPPTSLVDDWTSQETFVLRAREFIAAHDALEAVSASARVRR